ncbi:MAG: hypothetical protein HEP71_33395 [Roseivirga sp.]|nr:hypothetical protein [Roseivirga sp.]
MKKFNWIIVAILVLIVAFSSCDHTDTEPQQNIILNQLSEGGGDDDEEVIIIGDTTDIDP